MRYIDNPSKSLVSIEVRNNRIVQARMKNNEEVTSEIRRVLNKWQKTLINVSNK